MSIDTRTLEAGELFVAIRGERFDGAEFAGAAIEAGAAGVVVPRGWQPWRGAGPAERDRSSSRSTTRRWRCRRWRTAIRRESGTQVVAITGSAGKTTTKEVTSEFLEARYRVVRNRGNFNNHIGLPLSLIELRQRPEIAVVELGMNHAGEISTLVRVAEPDVRVWTNVGEAHLGFFASLDAIADAKAEILEGASASTLLVANADDERIVGADRRRSRGRVVTFGIERRRRRPRDARRRSRHRGHQRARDDAARQRRRDDAARRPGEPGERPGRDRGGARVRRAAGGRSPRRPPRLRPAAHRGEVVRLAGGVTVIDDSYNANPTATRRALDVLASAQATRRIAVLGEMLELGDRADRRCTRRSAARRRDAGVRPAARGRRRAGGGAGRGGGRRRDGGGERALLRDQRRGGRCGGRDGRSRAMSCW